MKADKQVIVPGEEVTITITATDLNISSALLFTFTEVKSFRLKVLMPRGFVQTGGDYIDYIGTSLSPEKPSVVYTIKGHFSEFSGVSQFRLLRGPLNADANSLFVEKSQLPITVKAAKGAREATDNVTLTADCGSSTLNISGYLSISNPNVTIVLYRDNNYVGSISDVPGPSFNRTYPINGSGSYYARVVEVNNDGNNITSSPVSFNCSSTPSPPTNPNPPTNPTLPSTGGGLAFQILSYDCTTGILRYQITGGDGSPIFLDLPGIIGSNVMAGTVLTHEFPGDGRTGRTVSGSASQSGQVTSINFTNGCGQNTPTNSNPPNNPTPPASGGCGTGSGLNGFYVNNIDLSQNPVMVRTDAQINFSWNDSPATDIVNADGFSIRWLGKIEAPISGNYIFKTNNDDGTRVWINNQLLIDDWNGHAPTWRQGSTYLTAGQKYDIVRLCCMALSEPTSTE